MYQGQIDSYRQNRLFENNQKHFYRELDQEEERCDVISLRLKNQNSFGEKYGASLQTIRRMQRGYKTYEAKLMLKKIDITTGNLKKILGRMPNWKSPGRDLVLGFWLKNFSNLHERVRLQLKEYLDSGFVPGWLTRGRTSL